jgi:uncharacterized protein (TIGR02145 family)
MKIQNTISALFLLSSTLLQAQSIMNIHQSNGTVIQIPLNTIDSITYTIPNPGNLATLTTLPIGNSTSTTAISGGNITNTGGTPVTQRGVVWSTTPNPTTANNSTIDGSGSGSFTSNLFGLTSSTTYYVRAYATNSAGTAYGNQLSFTTSVGIITNPGTGVTFDGYTYSSIVLGNGQEWMAENLRTTVYANGDPIPNITDSSQWSNLTSGAWVHYNNDIQNEYPHGKLYNWYAVADPRNACPTGWHVPSDAEWSSFINYLDPNADGGNNANNIAGNKMKSTGAQYWQSPNSNATNESGFSGLPSGVRLAPNLDYNAMGIGTVYLSSTEYNTNENWNISLLSGFDSGTRAVRLKTGGASIRCLKN